MPEDLNEVFVEVALACYDRVRKLQPGSEDAEAAEHAISMALRGDRTEKDGGRLLADLLHNSRFSVRRSRARRLRAMEECGNLARQGIVTGAAPGLVDRETPETACIAGELSGHLSEEASRCGSHGPRVLRGLLADETYDEISNASGVSPATVSRTVRRLRDTVEANGLRRAA